MRKKLLKKIKTVNKPALNMRLLKQILETLRPSYSPVTWFHPLLDSRLPPGANKVVDTYGNIFVLVGDSEQSDVAFTSHLDTVARANSQPPKVKMTQAGVLYVSNPDTADCLGADCGAGVYLMLEMLEHGIPGRYCFFRDEEVGCQGSSDSAQDATGFWTGVKAMISFDRRGDGIITSQRWSPCCSVKFATELARRLGRTEKHLQSGIYTDSAEFTHIVPECTNVGVGYMHEHTPDEVLDTVILQAVLEKVLDPATFKDLPIEREPAARSSFSFTNTHGFGQGWAFDTPTGEDANLLRMFREVSQLGRPALMQWINDNPEDACTYLMLFSDYGFKADIIELGSRVAEDWGGSDNLY